jgi:hypothetical protein
MSARAGFFATLAAVGFATPAWSDGGPAVPGPGFDGGRYAGLWTKSPFAIATPDAPAASQDYELVGSAQFGGISYVSLINKQDQYHFVLASDKPLKDPSHKLDLKLVSISHGHDGSSAVILQGGQSLMLQQEDARTAPAGMPALSLPRDIIPPPGMVPSPNPSVGGFVPAYTVPPRVRLHHPLTRIPPPPN